MSVPNAGGRALTWEDLPELFPAFAVPGRWVELLMRHAALLAAAADRIRVTAVGEDDMVKRHYAESLEILRIASEAGWDGEACDVGSGGGFPGLVFAAVRPDLSVHLVEPLQKRAKLLERVVTELGMSNVHVYAVRAEDAGHGPLRNRCGLVTARAVAALRELLEYTAPLAAPGALVAIPKGSALDEEIDGAGRAMDTLGVMAEGRVAMRRNVSEHIEVLLLRKQGPTPPGYPRRAGVPAKRPL